MGEKRATKTRWHQNTRHHRCPRRWGGTTCPENIVILKRWEHDAWHRLVNHQYPTSIALQLNTWRLFPEHNIVATRIGLQYPDMSDAAQTDDIIKPTMTRVQLHTWYTLRHVWVSRAIRVNPPVELMRYITTRYLHPDFVLHAYPLPLSEQLPLYQVRPG